MGHILGYQDEKIDSKFSKTQTENDIRRYSGGRMYDPIRWIDKIFPDRESAKAYIERADRGFYDSLAVMYGTKKTNKKVETIEERIKSIKASINKCATEGSIHSFKAKLVGCPKCESRLNKKYFKGESCPLCGTELRSETTVNRLNSLYETLAKKQKEIGRAHV